MAEAPTVVGRLALHAGRIGMIVRDYPGDDKQKKERRVTVAYFLDQEIVAYGEHKANLNRTKVEIPAQMAHRVPFSEVTLL